MSGARNRTIGTSFDPGRNSLNVLRLLLAVTVIASHAIDLGEFGRDWIGTRTTIGTVAVYGFFGISGFLIARSAERNSFGRYLWQRFLRIFPAFWVCLVVTAFVLAFVGWETQLRQFHLHGTVSNYLHAPNGPFGFVIHNFFLHLGQPLIIRSVWNGSLWTLWFEFICYLVVGLLAVVGLLRRPLLVGGLAVVLWVTNAVFTAVPSLNAHVTIKSNYDWPHLLVLVPLFLTGALIHLYRDRIPDSPWLAGACVAAFVGSLWIPSGAPTPGDTLTSTSLFAPFIAYPIIWLGIHLPLHKVGATHDYSYGMYIYAYPVQVLLAIWGVTKWGYAPYALLGVAATVPLAVASWWLVERPALRLKRWTPGLRPVDRSATPGAEMPTVQVQSPDASGL